jgi:hypothetical protein
MSIIVGIHFNFAIKFNTVKLYDLFCAINHQTNNKIATRQEEEEEEEEEEKNWES